jgi:hypothetical protein
MDRGDGSRYKTGGRQRGTPNKLAAQLNAKLAEAATQVSSPQVAAMMPLEVMLHAMRFEAEHLNWRTAASIAEKAYKPISRF